ncbi:MAG: hypothetical protein A2X61_15800 [Ignavibacteria bacterium GWB2_35_12]|nr:MAG: hypothetical protein A2X63_10760 [Ignavibacteria bacterium GWA2_35_8]OGU40838.1 MAG: hypothetical protein A2X61_15800 [Ignavibacteria bacterium GWB2_35_12]OGU87130.1 MAG: hypothetical protein A2220_08175 [Ignavibacteria bacterium RIFOXYA2_FULL_35_10]OGV24665.1 MAG: hypothetical protein A2475_14575 [Ignavibacteria bacterium RIFOXYC2_FULL_35_21]
MKHIIIALLLLLVISCSDNPTTVHFNNVNRTYLHAYDFARNFFIIDTSYKSVIEEYYKLGYIPQAVAPLRIKEIEVWESNNNFNDSSVTFIGIAFADLETKKYLMGERYNESLLHIPPTSGIVEMSNFVKLDSSKYTIDYNLGILHLKELKYDRYYAVSYRVDGATKVSDDDEYYGTMSNLANPKDTLILKLIYRPNLLPAYRTLWQRQLKNYYSFDTKDIDVNKTDVKMYYIKHINDTTDVLDSLPDKLVTILGVDRLNNSTGNPVPDGKFDWYHPNFYKEEGIIIFPSLQPFNEGLKSYFQKINRNDLIEKYIFPEVYYNTYEEARSNTAKDRFLIVIETEK